MFRPFNSNTNRVKWNEIKYYYKYYKLYSIIIKKWLSFVSNKEWYKLYNLHSIKAKLSRAREPFKNKNKTMLDVVIPEDKALNTHYFFYLQCVLI